MQHHGPMLPARQLPSVLRVNYLLGWSTDGLEFLDWLLGEEPSEFLDWLLREERLIGS